MKYPPGISLRKIKKLYQSLIKLKEFTKKNGLNLIFCFRTSDPLYFPVLSNLLKNNNNACLINFFQVITPFRSLVLCGESRQEMEEWLQALRTAGEGRPQGDAGTAELLGGNHHWYATSHARPTYCNVCRDALYGNDLMLDYL